MWGRGWCTGVGAAGAACDDVKVGAEDVDQLALALIAPLAAHHGDHLLRRHPRDIT